MTISFINIKRTVVTFFCYGIMTLVPYANAIDPPEGDKMMDATEQPRGKQAQVKHKNSTAPLTDTKKEKLLANLDIFTHYLASQTEEERGWQLERTYDRWNAKASTEELQVYRDYCYNKYLALYNQGITNNVIAKEKNMPIFVVYETLYVYAKSIIRRRK